MGIYRSNKCRFQAKKAAKKSLEVHQKLRKNHRVALVSQIEQLPQQEVFVAAHLFNTMRYSKGFNKNEILSPYLQNKAQEFILQNSYKHQSVQSLKEMNHQLLTNNKKLNKKIFSISPEIFNEKMKSLFKVNKRDYSPNMIWLAIRISQVGQVSVRSTIECIKTANYRIMLDESTRVETKQFVICLIFWDLDKEIPVAQTNSSTIQIGCGLHILHIILTNFEQEAFGKLSSTIGFQKTKHLFMLFTLTWYLHNGYNSSDKDQPLGMTSEIINQLYDSLIGFHFNQYQEPLRTR
ncbi:hypothetical protein C2G38_2151764 [Gigaspora rosea]|uniref:Uncharacterized protein n=1 Tax=Gigaspora rosea TaxID=44941 RepID=A0A397WAW8_9GLOM|nr:hypothetical protein C2G38_2151764 [Gigaspora rosea]